MFQSPHQPNLEKEGINSVDLWTSKPIRIRVLRVPQSHVTSIFIIKMTWRSTSSRFSLAFFQFDPWKMKLSQKYIMIILTNYVQILTQWIGNKVHLKKCHDHSHEKCLKISDINFWNMFPVASDRLFSKRCQSNKVVNWTL